MAFVGQKKKKTLKLTVGAHKRVNGFGNPRKDRSKSREMISGSWSLMSRLKSQYASECVTVRIFICIETKIKFQW